MSTLTDGRTAPAAAHATIMHRFRAAAAAVLVAVAVPIAILICNPFVEIGVNDDWVYIRMAKVLASTGHLQYDGWTAAMTGVHAVWGALAIRLFGFSFSVARAAMFPVAAACSLLIYGLARRTGLPRGVAMLATFTCVLSPLFLPLAASFMTEASALLLLLLTIYFATRAIDSAGAGHAMIWLAAAALAGVLAGTVRQVMWGAPVWVIIAFAILRRGKPLLAGGAAALLAGVLAAIAACMRWLYAQPNSFSGHWFVMPSLLSVATWRWEREATALCLALLSLPVLVYFLSDWRIWKRNLLFFSAASVVLIFVGLRRPAEFHPFVGNIVTVYGGLLPDQDVLGDKPVILPPAALDCLGFIVAFALVFTVIALARQLWTSRSLTQALDIRDRRFLVFLFVAAPFLLGYMALLIAESEHVFIFDRYFVPLIPFIAISLCWAAWRSSPSRTLAPAAMVTMVFAVYGIATTHDALRASQARADAAVRFLSAGVPRKCLSGGYEYDGWTQLEAAGVIRVPRARTDPYRFWFLDYTPVVQPRYLMTLSVEEEFSKPLMTIPYSTWLPPRRREVLIQEDPDVTCSGIP